jgi:hypothetical protein
MPGLLPSILKFMGKGKGKGNIYMNIWLTIIQISNNLIPEHIRF